MIRKNIYKHARGLLFKCKSVMKTKMERKTEGREREEKRK
jgi:hypothetical protein